MADLWTRLDYRNWFVPAAITNPCFPAMDTHIQCKVCVDSCQDKAITKQWGTITVDPERCCYCGRCYEECPGDLIGIQGLDKILVKLKNDREKGAITLYPHCDKSRHSDVPGAFRVPTFRFISPEIWLWTAALGYQKIALPDRKRCENCREDCYDYMLGSVESANKWLKHWDKQLMLQVREKEEKPPERQLTRRELFFGLGKNVKREVTELVVEELETRLTMVLPKTEQGYMRRQNLKAMAVKLLAEPQQSVQLGSQPLISDQCSGCRVCSKQCPTRALTYEADGLIIKPWLCNDCGFCVRSCPQEYISMKPISDYKTYFQLQRNCFNIQED